MTPERFEALTAAYGADPRRWPEDERDAALAFAAGPRAQAILARERRLDDLLDRALAPRATPQMVGRFAATPRRERVGFAAQAAALAAAALLGLFVGWSAPTPAEQLNDDDPWDVVMLDAWDEG